MNSNSESKRVIVFHEYGEPKHYVGLSVLIKNKSWDTERYIEFSPIKIFIKAILSRHYSKAIKALYDFAFLIFCYFFPFVLRGHIAVVGMAPFDAKLLFMRRVLSGCIVIYHSSWLYWDGTKYPKKNIFLKKAIEKCWYGFLTKDVSSFATVTDKVASQIQNNFNIAANKFTVVYHAYDEKIFSCESLETITVPSVIYAGRLIENKGIHLILAMARHNPSIRFEFAGQGSLEGLIRGQAKTLSNVVYHGFISSPAQLANIFNRSQIVLLPSLRTETWEELFGISLIEAMACGCVPIVTNHYGPSVICGNSRLEKFCLSESDFYEHAVNIISDLMRDCDGLTQYRKTAVRTATRFNMSSIAQAWDKVLFFAIESEECK